jgi:hypothetical protein
MYSRRFASPRCDEMLHLKPYLHRRDAPLTAVYVGSQRSLGTQSIEDSKNDAMARQNRSQWRNDTMPSSSRLFSMEICDRPSRRKSSITKSLRRLVWSHEAEASRNCSMTRRVTKKQESHFSCASSSRDHRRNRGRTTRLYTLCLYLDSACG